MSIESAILALSPVDYFPMSETSGASAQNLGSSGNNWSSYDSDVVLANEVFVGDSPFPYFSATSSQCGLSVGIDTPNTYPQWTCTGFFKPGAMTGGRQYIWNSYTQFNHRSPCLFLDDDSSIRVELSDVSNPAVVSEVSSAPNFITSGQVYYFVIHYDGVNVRLDINQVTIGSASVNAFIGGVDSATIFGTDTVGSGAPYRGHLAHFAVFNSALTQQELDSIYVAAYPTQDIEAMQGGQAAEVSAQKLLNSIIALQGLQQSLASAIPAQTATIKAEQTPDQTAQIAATVIKPPSYVWGVQASQQTEIGTVSVGGYDKFYFATAGLTTTADSTPAHFEIPPTLKNPGNFKNEIDIKNFGVVTPSIGTITISNLNGEYDELLTRGIDGQSVTLYRGKRKSNFPGEFQKVLVATASGVSGTLEEIRVTLRNNIELLNRPYLTKRFSGVGGAEGDAGVQGQLRQAHIGEIKYLPPILIDSQKLIYLVSDSPARKDHFLAYDGGVPIYQAQKYGSVLEMESVAPAPGQVRFLAPYAGPIYMRLGSAPAYDLRVRIIDIYHLTAVPDYAKVVNIVGNHLAADKIGELIDERVSGRLVRDDETVMSILSDFCKRQFVCAWVTNLNKLFCERFASDPDASTGDDFVLNKHNIISMSIRPTLPAKRVALNFGETFPSYVAPAATPLIKQDMTKSPWMSSQTIDIPGAASKHALAKEVSVNSKNWDHSLTSISAELADVIKKIYNEHIIVDVKVEDTPELLNVNINDVGMLKIDRFDFENGSKFTVIGVRRDFAQNSFFLSLWR